MSLTKYFSFIDLFKKPVVLKFEKEEKTSTNLGIVISIAIIIFLMINFSSSDIFHRISPNLTTQILDNINRPSLTVIDKVLTFSIVDDNNMAYHDPTIFSFRIQNEFMSSNATAGGFSYDQIINKPLHLCKPEDFHDPLLFDNLGLNNNYCINQSENNYTMYGYWDEPKLGYLFIELLPCKNETNEDAEFTQENNETNNTNQEGGKEAEERLVCKSEEEISNFFQGKYFNFIYEDYNINGVNYEQPIKNIYKNIFYSTDLKLKKILNVYFQKAELYTDDGLMMTDEKVEETVVSESKELDFYFVANQSADSYAPFRCVFYPSRQTKMIKRVYQKLSEAFANLGGMANFLIIFGGLLTILEATLYLKKMVMNSLYSFQRIKTVKKKSKKDKKKKFDLSKNDNKEIEIIQIEPNTSKEKEQDKMFDSPHMAQIDKVFKKKTLPSLNRSFLNEETKINLKKNIEIKKEISFEKKIIVNEKNSPLEYLQPKILKEDQIVKENSNEFFENKNEMLESTEIKLISNERKESDSRLMQSEAIQEQPSGTGLRSSKRHSSLSANIKKNLGNLPINRLKNWKSKANENIQKRKEIESYQQNVEKLAHENKLEFSMYEFIKMKFRQLFKIPLSFREKLFLKADNTNADELDIITILKKLHEIDKLKIVLMNNDQLTLFNLMPQPMIFLDQKEYLSEETFGSSNSPGRRMSEIMISSRVFESNKLVKVFESFEILKKEKKMTEIDKRLINLLENAIKDFNKKVGFVEE